MSKLFWRAMRELSKPWFFDSGLKNHTRNVELSSICLGAYTPHKGMLASLFFYLHRFFQEGKGEEDV